MKLIELVFRRDTLAPLLALTLASAVAVALAAARIAVTHHLRYGLLVWNLILAWLPLIFAMLAREQFKRDLKGNWRFAGAAGAWLLFFPNAPYIFTDIIHLHVGSFRHYWVDLTLILIFALTGLVLGFLSLYLMHALARQVWGGLRSWLFVLAVTALSGFGIYLGRVLRFNSWDVLVKPVKLIQGVSSWAGNPLADSSTWAFPVLYAVFLFLAYVMLYALTHLPQMHALSAPAVNNSLNLTPA